MPAEYKACVRSLIEDGKPLESAQRICAIRYFKLHGRTPQQDESASFTDDELTLFSIIKLIGDSGRLK